MRRESVIVFAVLAIISLMITGCGKKAGPRKTHPAKQQETVKSEVVSKSAGDEETAPEKTPALSDKPITEEKVLFSFEQDVGDWEIPCWAMDKDDHVAKSIDVSKDVASEGECSMKIDCDFPGDAWTAAVIELEQFLDFTPYREIVVDIYVPKDTPLGLRSKIILTVGDDWMFTEMARTVPLVPGEWVEVIGNIEPGSYDWKRTVPDESFRADIRKIVVRIESNRRPIYKGPVYIDNVRIRK
ncbi:MAG: hypothetical protein A2Z72_07630 [Omnitrophica bacterium RBG_13_46_9]|nr:MAG: hypothetical protein A2Z72_07630 [Omnitrophica bacterium RBG_13_46_9]